MRCEPCSIPRAPIRTCAARRERLETESQACRRGRERVVGAGPVPDRDSPPQKASMLAWFEFCTAHFEMSCDAVWLNQAMRQMR